MDEFRPPPGEAVAPLLAAFEAAATELHVTRAAELLRTPQSTVSRRIQSLEQLLGVSLFTPDGRGVRLTPTGHDLLLRIRGPLRAIDDAVRHITTDADPEIGLVRFGFPLTLGPVSIPSLLADFHHVAPGIRLRLVQAHAEALTQLLSDGGLDVAIIIPAPLGVRSTSLGSQPIQLYVPRTHRLATRRQVDLAELVDETFIANPPTYNLRQLLESWCAEAGFAPNVALEITEFETLRALVARGLGIALLPAAETEHADLVGIRITGRRHIRSIGLVTAGSIATPAVEKLLRFLEQNAGSAIAGLTR